MNPKYYLNNAGDFVIENYNFAKPFASFFPGIAGKYGIPMWVFYVNRGQAIISLGTQDKDHSLLEFYPANKAWQLVSTLGFRTFLKVNDKFYEPFNYIYPNLKFEIKNKLYINSYELKLEEINFSLDIKINVEYFTLPSEPFAGLVRIIKIKNLKKASISLRLLDGLPKIIPYGISNLFLKKLNRTIEAWMKVSFIKDKIATYKIEVDPHDRPEIIYIKGANFYLSFYSEDKKSIFLRPVVEPDSVFGPIKDFSLPYNFYNDKKISPKETPIAKTPCGFIFLKFKLKPNEEKEIFSLLGYVTSPKLLEGSLERISKPGYLLDKKQENKEIIAELQKNISTESSCKIFDLYAKQTYLDNLLRGGYPYIFSTETSKTVFYIYGRKHGDLERDYNKFELQPNYLSQGNGNFRDINQNRRCDVWFNPEVKDENVIKFFNLIQTDGFNPLVIKDTLFILKKEADFKEKLKNLTEEKNIPKILDYLKEKFNPGELLLYLEENNIKLKTSYDEFLGILFSFCEKEELAEHTDGYWTDHWTYNIDLLENYLKIYPEELENLIFKKRVFTFYDNSRIVKPRRKKYLLINGKVKQLKSVEHNEEKERLIRQRKDYPHLVREDFGRGKIYYTTLINKLLCILVNKISSLDPFGVGIEMEADKPNWFDALNGLPGLLGSSVCETFELKRLVIFIKDALKKLSIKNLSITEEIYDFILNLNTLLKDWMNSRQENKDLIYWDKSQELKEKYREITLFGVSGREKELELEILLDFLENALKKLDYGIEKAKLKQGLWFSYFINEVVEYEILEYPFVKPKKFIQRRLPLFLEAQMHVLRLAQNLQEAKIIYKATKTSTLFDKKLKMYKITASLKDAPLEIGRCCVFPPGWLENESIWLHMEYKYILELLKKELIEEFYTEFKNVLVCFQNPRIYGRSPLENSSFIVSSVFPDKKLIGTGFVARLSGSTAEFLEIWLMMNIGKEPFFLNKEGKLNLEFKPNLAGWLFKKDGTYKFKFLGKTDIVYHNPKRSDTFGKEGVKVRKIVFNSIDNRTVEINSSIIPSPYAEQIRSGLIKRIDIYLE